MSEILAQTEKDSAKLDQARSSGDQIAELAISIQMGSGLYILERETEAVPILGRARELAQTLGDKRSEIEATLHYATAIQYLGQRKLAQELFTAALALSRVSGMHDFDHFILHHQGRCYVEQSGIESARERFQQALELRKRLGVERFITSTQQALEELNALGT